MNPNNALDCALKLLELAKSLHAKHLSALKYSKHKALEGAYELATQYADLLAEQALGMGHELETNMDPIADIDATIGAIREFCDTTDDAVLKNTAEEIIGGLYRQKYLLTLE